MYREADGPANYSTVGSWWFACLVGLAIGIVFVRFASPTPNKVIVGATAEVVEHSSGLKFSARVDTGASVSSLHCTAIEIEDPSDEPEANSGKPVRFQVVDSQGNEQWLEATILGYAGVRNSTTTQGRYRVRLRLECRGIVKETLVSLNDRSAMKYSLLLGRDFLQGDFVVDVGRDNPDWP